MNRLFRLVLTMNATILLVIVYMVQHQITIQCIFPNFIYFQNLHRFISFAAYSIFPIIITKIIISVSVYLGKDEFKKGDLIEIEHANNSFLPSYLGYFFVALSIQNFDSLIFVYTVLFIFTYKSQALYFNPLFLLFGFEFYNITTKKGTKIFLISQNKYRHPGEVTMESANRINNYTFIERGKK